jgi:hypothetical protein
MTAVSNTQPYPEEHTTAIDKKPEILIAWATVVLATSPSNRIRDYPLPYMFCCIRMLYRTTPTGRHRRGWDDERQKEGRKK